MYHGLPLLYGGNLCLPLRNLRLESLFEHTFSLSGIRADHLNIMACFYSLILLTINNAAHQIDYFDGRFCRIAMFQKMKVAYFSVTANLFCHITSVQLCSYIILVSLQ